MCVKLVEQAKHYYFGSNNVEVLDMSHCCGGCGGEDPLMKNKESGAQEKGTEKPAEKAVEASKPLKTETWQPDKK